MTENSTKKKEPGFAVLIALASDIDEILRKAEALGNAPSDELSGGIRGKPLQKGHE